jgi:hypothetical protein
MKKRIRAIHMQGNLLGDWNGSGWKKTPWARDHKWSRVCPFTGKDFLERYVLALKLLRISSSNRITTVIMVLLECKKVVSSNANGTRYFLCWHCYHLPMYDILQDHPLDVDNGDGKSWSSSFSLPSCCLSGERISR